MEEMSCQINVSEAESRRDYFREFKLSFLYLLKSLKDWI